MKHLLFACLFLASQGVSAQSLPLSVVAAAGDTAITTGSGGIVYTLYFTVGEAAIQDAGNGNLKAPEGFWQCPVSFMVDVVQVSGTLLHIGVYPNPSADRFTLNIEGDLTTPLQCLLYDPTGRMVDQARIQPADTQVQIGAAGLPPGLYFLTLQLPGGNTLRTFKVQKIN